MSLRTNSGLGFCGRPVLGLIHVLGAFQRFPGRPMIGKLLSHVIGTSATIRPMLPWSCMMMLHHSPEGVSTMPPWCSVSPPPEFGSAGVIVKF